MYAAVQYCLTSLNFVAAHVRYLTQSPHFATGFRRYLPWVFLDRRSFAKGTQLCHRIQESRRNPRCDQGIFYSFHQLATIATFGCDSLGLATPLTDQVQRGPSAVAVED